MVNAGTGINFNIYPKMIIKYGTDVVLTSVTKTTSNIEGDETLTDGSTATIRAFLTRKNRPWFVDKAGLIEGGDAVMLVKPTDTVNRNDKVTWNNNTYRIQNVLARDQGGGNIAFYSCNLFLL
jgi:hypothetical protein